MMERKFYRERRLLFWIERQSFESVRGVVWRDWERESFDSMRRVLGRDREIEYWERIKGLLEGIQKNRVFERRDRLFEGIGARRFESRDAAVWRDWEGVLENGERWVFEGIDKEFSERRETTFELTDGTIWTTTHTSTHPWKRIGQGTKNLIISHQPTRHYSRAPLEKWKQLHTTRLFGKPVRWVIRFFICMCF